tara:strand:- start:1068 stop:1301 length:234 start_codon:yes stop_codon:yes gene_type:complete
MEITVHLDGNPTIREEGFFESQVITLENQIKALQFDNAELNAKNDELGERVTKLAARQPAWPKGYSPRRHDRFKKRG